LQASSTDRTAPTVDSLHPQALRPGSDHHAALGLACVPVASSDWQALLGGPPLNAAELNALNTMAHLRSVPTGASVMRREQPARHLLAVLSGAVGLGQARSDQPFHLERTVRGPAWLDLSSAWLGQGFGQDGRAQSEVRVLELPLAALRSLLAREAAMLDRLLVGLAQTVQSLTGTTHDLMHKDAEKRLAAWLLQQAGGQPLLQLSERKRDIAAQLAITPETLSRMMRQLKLKGLIEVQGYAVRLLNTAQLAQLAAD
jgi:CRP-like cAMP-binding protein